MRSIAAVVVACLAAGCAVEATGTSGGPGGTSGASGSSGAGGTSGDDGTSGTSGNTYDNPPNNGATRPPPIITSVDPLAGDYGTTVTIVGDNLDEASAELVLAGPAEPVKIGMPVGAATSQPTDVVLSWSKTKIEIRYPFPAEGAIGITTKSGEAQGGSFVPSWTPGTPISGVFTRRELLAVVAPAAGTLVGLFDGQTGPYVLVAKPDASIASKAWARGASPVMNASLYAKSDGTVDGVFAQGGTLHTLTDAAGAATTAATSVAALDAAGGIDATGPYAWVRQSGTVARVRPPSWTASGSVTDPTPASAPGPSIAVAPDQSLYVGWGYNDSGSFPLYDHTAWPLVRRLRSGQSAFDAQRQGGSGADDDMIWTRFLAGPGGRVFSYYCANDTGFFDTTGTLDCGEGYIDGLGQLHEPTTYTESEHVSGWNATTAYETICPKTTATLAIGPEGDTAQRKDALFPCPRVVAIAVDPANAPVLLVQSGNYTYAPKKRN